ILGLQLFNRRDFPWLPKRILEKEVNVGERPRLIKTMVFFLRIIEFFIRPRLSFIFENAFTFRFLALIVMICGTSMIIPIPLTNTAPAFGIFLIGLGMLEEDGLLSIAGVLASLAGVTLTITVLSALVYFGWEGIDIVREFLKGLF
ncbi:MAG TPA: exopolysaccharide biosynthesis protein, partial [Candidatus Hydrogenedentes bacterium]|nr:exopolysaccharide biosynthesis protein [Candidatus Hydrogenedentota bacterium]